MACTKQPAPRRAGWAGWPAELLHHVSYHEKERDLEIHHVRWASKAYEDESVFMSEAHLGWQ